MTMKHTSTTLTFKITDEPLVEIEEGGQAEQLRASGAVCIMNPQDRITVIDVTGHIERNGRSTHVRFASNGAHRPLVEAPSWILDLLHGGGYSI